MSARQPRSASVPYTLHHGAAAFHGVGSRRRARTPAAKTCASTKKTERPNRTTSGPSQVICRDAKWRSISERELAAGASGALRIGVVECICLGRISDSGYTSVTAVTANKATLRQNNQWSAVHPGVAAPRGELNLPHFPLRLTPYPVPSRKGDPRQSKSGSARFARG